MTEINDLLAKPECLVCITTRNNASALAYSLLCASNTRGVYVTRAKEVFPTESAFPRDHADRPYNEIENLWAVYALREK